ncbi:hypothetical protein [Mycolicibacterium thermoresistibile]
MSTDLDPIRAVADAVLYEGYLLYPYRASSRKNQTRWQFGVLGPPGAEQAGLGENDTLAAQFVVQGAAPTLTLVVRLLHLQHRAAQRATATGFEPVPVLTTGDQSWLSWDEAVEHEIRFGPQPLAPQPYPFSVPASTDIETVAGGRLVRTRAALHGVLTVTAETLTAGPADRIHSVGVTVRNTGAPAADKDEAIARSLIGTHVIAEVSDGEFVSLLEPPAPAADAVARCRQHRCFPVLAGPPGTHDLLLVSPIILYDHPEIAEQSRGALYDSTEIDEILTLRIMTLTDEEKAQARATDPLAAQLIDRCDTMSPDAMLELHGVLRDPHAADRRPNLIPEVPDGLDWWDPMADTAVDPGADAVLVNGVAVRRGSRVRLHPARRADAQDLFFADRTARVTSVHEDVDGAAHVGVVLDDDPAADLHDWYGRYLYFAPDEIEPLTDNLEERNPTWK